jgi:hypothetical protein
MGMDSKFLRIFDKPVTTDKHDSRFFLIFFAEKFSPTL